MQQEYLWDQQKTEGNIEPYVGAFSDSTVVLTLYMDNTSKDSVMLENLLNFYNVAFDKVTTFLAPFDHIGGQLLGSEIQSHLPRLAQATLHEDAGSLGTPDAQSPNHVSKGNHSFWVQGDHGLFDRQELHLVALSPIVQCVCSAVNRVHQRADRVSFESYVFASESRIPEKLQNRPGFIQKLRQNLRDVKGASIERPEGAEVCGQKLFHFDEKPRSNAKIRDKQSRFVERNG